MPPTTTTPPLDGEVLNLLEGEPVDVVGDGRDGLSADGD